MTDLELNSVYKQLLDVGPTAAVRAIYNLGFAAGGATPVTETMADSSALQSKPSDAAIAAIKKHARTNLAINH